MIKKIKILLKSFFANVLKNEFLQVGIFFILILILFFSQAIFNNLSLVPAETIYQIDNLYRGVSLPQNIRGNGILFDLTFQMYPWAEFTFQSLRQGFIPLWNPYSLAGLPYLANDQSSIFELTKLFSYLLRISAKDLLLFTSFLTLFLAGLFTYLFARNLSISKTGSLISGFAFAFSGPVMVWLGYPLTTTILWLPFLLLASDKIIKGGKFLWVILLALGIAFQFFGGNPEISLFILLITAAFVIFRFLQNYKFYKTHYKKLLKKIILLSVAVIFGLLISIPQLMPTFEFVLQSEAMRTGRGGAGSIGFFEAISAGQWLTWHNLKDIKQSLEDLVLLVFPDFFGNPALGQYWKGTNYNESANYVGIISLIFALMAVFWGIKKKNSNVIFWTVVAFLVLFIFLRFPIFNLAAFLPFLKIVSLSRLRFIFVFALAILAGYGTDYFFEKFSQSKIKEKTTLKNIAAFNSLLILIIFFIFGTVYIWQKISSRSLTQELWTKEKALLLIIFLLINLTFVLFVKFRKFKLSFIKILFVIFVVGELFYYGYKYHPAIPKILVYPKTEAIEFLQKNINNYRLTSYKNSLDNFSSSLLPNSSVIWGLQDIRGYEILQPERYDAFQRHFAGGDSRFTYKSFDPKVFNLLGVKYFIQGNKDPENAELKQLPNLSLAYYDNSINIYENKTVLPRAFISFNIHPVKNYYDAIDVFSSNNFRTDMVALIEIEKEESINFSNSPSAKIQEAKIVNYSPNKVEVATDIKKDGFLVLTDSYYPGWKAYVDEKEVKIFPADIAFRGIFIPQGQHKIIFEYKLNFSLLH